MSQNTKICVCGKDSAPATVCSTCGATIMELSRVVNLTQHPASDTQLEAGVQDLNGEDHSQLTRLLTFDELPTSSEVNKRASAIAELAAYIGCRGETAMIGGAPYLMPQLECELMHRGIKAVYAYSRRRSVERTNDDGTVSKTATFEHLGFVGCDPHLYH